MFNGLCDSGNWGFLGNFGAWGGIGLILNLVFWVGLIAALTLLVIWAIRRVRVPAATVPNANGQPTAREILQAQYARGEITREPYEVRKQDIGWTEGLRSDQGEKNSDSYLLSFKRDCS